jgi:small-conductance mechanosensitive channel
VGRFVELKVAEWVLAIGNPFQLNETVTLGIVSAVNRNNIGLAQYEDFIQTDAAINPGNSGGALVNGRGELVGINTAIFSQSGGYQGIGFAVPSNLARKVAADLQQFHQVRRGSIGSIQIAPLTTQLAQELGAPDTKGIVIGRMRRDSAAYQAGLRPGDVIIAFNGTPVTDGGQLSRMVQDARIGSTAAVGDHPRGPSHGRASPDHRLSRAPILLALALALAIAYVVAEAAARVAQTVLRSILPDERRFIDRPRKIVRLVVFIVTSAALALPAVRMAGYRTTVGGSPEALARWALDTGLRIAIIAVTAYFVVRVGSAGARRFEREMSSGSGLDVIERTKRAQTLSRLLQKTLTILVMGVAGLMILRELRVDITPVLTGAGIVGLAVGFGAQTLVRDVISGFFLILEDQVRVGDVAVVNGQGGLVEEVNLRTIVLRDEQGSVHVFPNGEVKTLANMSKDFSYFVISLPMSFEEDPDRVLAVMTEVGIGLRDDPNFKAAHPGAARSVRDRRPRPGSVCREGENQDRADEAVDRRP